MDPSHVVIAIFLTFVGVILIRLFSNLDIDTAKMWAAHNKSTNTVAETSDLPEPIIMDVPQQGSTKTEDQNHMNYHTPQWWKTNMDRIAAERERHQAEKTAVMSR